jgi:hypothetical protein
MKMFPPKHVIEILIHECEKNIGEEFIEIKNNIKDIINLSLDSNNDKLLEYLSNDVPDIIMIDENYLGKEDQISDIIASICSFNDKKIVDQIGKYIFWLNNMKDSPQYSDSCFESSNIHLPPNIFSYSAAKNAILSDENLISLREENKNNVIQTNQNKEEIKDIISIASKIARLRNIDLRDREGKFRSKKSFENSDVYKKIIESSKEEAKIFILDIFPLLNHMNESIHNDIIARIESKISANMSEAILEYEIILRDIMILEGHGPAAKSLAIGNKTSKLLDCPTKKIVRTERRKVRTAIFHSHKEILDLNTIKELSNIGSSSYSPDIVTFYYYLADRTKNICLMIDNLKRDNEVKLFNSGKMKRNPLICFSRSYDKKFFNYNISKLRLGYLLEHYTSLTDFGSISRVKFNQEELIKINSRIDSYKKKRLNVDIYCSVDIRTSGELLKQYKDFYFLIFSDFEEAKRMMDDISIAITNSIPDMLKDLGIDNATMPRLIRKQGGKKYGKCLDNPDIVRISHYRSKRYIENSDKEVPNFSLNMLRESSTINIDVSNMSPADIIRDVSDKLVNISEGRQVSQKELLKLSQMLRQAYAELDPN